MTGQKISNCLAAIAALMMVGGCESSSTSHAQAIAPRQDVEFLRGCWVRKESPDGKVLGFLRLLPPSVDAATYDGQVQDVSGQGPIEPQSQLSFVRDGSAASVTYAIGDATPTTYVRDHSPWFDQMPIGRYRSIFVRTGFYSELLIVEGASEQLKIFTTVRGSRNSSILFEGERDGCD
jgi:hypothetical protein